MSSNAQPSPVLPRAGVLGGGQLGRMLSLAGYPLGIRLRHIGGPDDTSAGEVAEEVKAGYDDRETLARFANGLNVVTYESENIPLETAEFLAQRVSLQPPIAALAASQDRLHEKRFFESVGVQTAPYAQVDSIENLNRALARIGTPAILKTRRFGYDGKGQAVIRDEAHAADALHQLGGTNLILEGFVRFERELSIIAVRSTNGETRFYPLVENHHEAGILRLSIAPAPELTPVLQQQGETIARRVLEQLDYAGVLAIELFQAGDQLLANEMAPRVHNSGHWTIEGATVSQFENHLRAILGLPLGETDAIGYSAMVNVIGTIPALAAVLAFPEAHLHLYGKQPRANRKLGHITVRGDDPVRVRATAEKLREIVRT